jgi:hypothetical protein
VRVVVVVIFQAMCWSDLGSIVVLVEGGETCEDGFTLVISSVEMFQ